MNYSLETLRLVEKMNKKPLEDSYVKVIELAKVVYKDNENHDIHFYAKKSTTGEIMR